MNRIQRIAAAAAVSAIVITHITLAPAFAEPYPWHQPAGGGAQPAAPTATKAQIENDERIGMQERCAGFIKAADPNVTDLPWDAAGVSALGAGALAAGGLALARRSHHEPRPA